MSIKVSEAASTATTTTAPRLGDGVPLARMPANETGLDRSSASVVYGETLLTLEPAKRTLWDSTAFTARCLAHPSVLPRIAEMWTTFRRYRDNIGAVVMTARRP
jgi:hypothetical protein